MAAIASSQTASGESLVIAEAQTTVAQPMGMEPPPLGLDRPLRLLGGGDRLLPLGMASAPGIDRVQGLRAFVAEACRRSAAAGEAYRQPPLALLGERGVGKGLVAAWIAHHADVPLYRARISDDTEHEGLGRRTHAPAQAWPAFPIVAMAASRCANPLVVVELDVDHPPSAEVEDALVSMINPRRASRWTDDITGSIVDLGHVSWLIEVHGQARRRGGWYDRDGNTVSPPVLPPRLEALVSEAGTILQVEARAEGEDLRRLDVAACVCAIGGLGAPEAVTPLFEALRQLSTPSGLHLPCEQLVRHAIDWVAERHAGQSS